MLFSNDKGYERQCMMTVHGKDDIMRDGDERDDTAIFISTLLSRRVLVIVGNSIVLFKATLTQA